MVVLIGGGTAAAVTMLMGGAASRAGSGPCQNGSVEVVIGADPGAAGWLSELARDYTNGRPKVDGRCVAARVEKLPVGQAATVLRSTPWPGGGTPPDVWVPDSSAVLDMMRSQPDNAAVLPSRGTSIASTPFVLAAPHDVARALNGKSVADMLSYLRRPPGDLGLPSGRSLPVALTDPAQTSTGLGLVLAAAGAATGAPAEQVTTDTFTNSAARTALLQLGSDVSVTTQESAGLVTRARSADSEKELLTNTGVMALSERDVWRYNGGKPDVPLQAVYPLGGSLADDYPYVVVRADWVDKRIKAAAEDFKDWLGGREARRVLADNGLRNPDGSGGALTGSGLDEAAMPPKKLASEAAAATARGAWSLLTSRRSVLMLMDVSGSMGASVPGTTDTKLDLARDAAVNALPYLSSSDQAGLWAFSTHLDGTNDYKPLVSLGPLSGKAGAQRHTALTAAFKGLIPQTGTGLYESILAAYDDASKHYLPGGVNAVVVLTDGRNEDPDGHTDLPTLLTDLAKRQNSSLPVRVITIGYGTDVDTSVLDQIAKVTGGMSFEAPDPRSISSVFIQALTAAS